MKNQQSYIPVSVAYLIFQVSTLKHQHRRENSVPCKVVEGGFEEIKTNFRRKKLHATNQGFNFLGDSFSNRDNVRAPIQFRR